MSHATCGFACLQHSKELKRQQTPCLAQAADFLRGSQQCLPKPPDFSEFLAPWNCFDTMDKPQFCNLTASLAMLIRGRLPAPVPKPVLRREVHVVQKGISPLMHCCQNRALLHSGTRF